jgi:O-antigen/teichoic acid export membrane protein
MTAPCALVLALFGDVIVHWWAGEQINPSRLLLIGLAIWSMLIAVGGPFAMLLNGARVIRIQVICATLMALTNIGLSIILTHRIGIAGVVYGSIIAHGCCMLLPYSIFVPRFLRQLGGGSQPEPAREATAPADAALTEQTFRGAVIAGAAESDLGPECIVLR